MTEKKEKKGHTKTALEFTVNKVQLKSYCPNTYTVDWKQIRSETQCENHAKTHSICV